MHIISGTENLKKIIKGKKTVETDNFTKQAKNVDTKAERIINNDPFSNSRN